MSVLEQLQGFRYLTTTRECPMQLIRGIDLGKLRIASPDLQLFKHTTSTISDCAIPTLNELQALAPCEVQQLLGVFQVMLQFSLHSQTVLRGQVSAKQTAITVEKVTSQQMAALEARLELAKKKLDEAAVERQATQTVLHAMEKQLIEFKTANALLDRELEFHRGTQRLISASKSAEAQNGGATPQGGPPPVAAGSAPPKKPREAKPAVVSDATSWEEGSDASAPRVRGARRSHGGRQRSGSEGKDRYVDWQSFAAMLVQQQQQQRPFHPASAVDVGTMWAAQTDPRHAASPPPPPQQQSNYQPNHRAPEATQPPLVENPVPDRRATDEILLALRNGLDENRVEILKQTHQVISSVEVGLTNRISRLQQEQRATQDSLAAQVRGNEQHWNAAFLKVTEQLCAVQDETNQQLRQLKQDVSIAVSSVSRQTSLAQPTVVATSSTPQQRSSSPSVLPPLPLSQVQQDLNNSNKVPTQTTAGNFAASPVGTPGSNAFGPRVASTTVSNSGDRDGDVTSDEDNDPYVPMSRQTADALCQHCRQRVAAAEFGAHEASCDLRMVKCPSGRHSVVARLLPAHKCEPSSPMDRGATSDSFQGDSSLNNTNSQAPITRKPSSQMLKDTQDELQRLLEEDAAEEARKAKK